MKIRTVSLIESEGEFSKGSVDNTVIWQLRNKLLEAIGKQSAKESAWIDIKSLDMVDTIVSIYGNALNRKILKSCVSKPHTMMEILSITNTPQATGYRKITSLIRDHFLFGYHTVQRKKGRKTISYLSTFKEIEFRMSENQEMIRVKLQDNFLQK